MEMSKLNINLSVQTLLSRFFYSTLAYPINLINSSYYVAPKVSVLFVVPAVTGICGTAMIG